VYPVPVQRLEGHPEAKRLTCGVVAFGLQQYAKVVDGGKRVLMPVAEGLAQPLYRLAVQRLSGGEVALVPQQHAEVVDGGERVWMPAAESLTLPLQRLAVEQFSGGEIALSCSSAPRLLRKLSVLGCRSPRVPRDTSSASRYIGSAAARSPLDCNSAPG